MSLHAADAAAEPYRCPPSFGCFEKFEPQVRKRLPPFWTRKAGPQTRLPLVVLVVVISSLKMPKAFLIRSSAQRNFAHTFALTFPTDLPSQILKLISN